MNFEEAAKSLIKAVDGEMSQDNIDGVVSVLNTVIELNNDNWEQFITEKTNESLAFDKITCDCGAKIEIERTSTSVYVDVV